jgi:hypothetical protein
MNPLRRSFFKGAGLLGALATGIATTKVVIEHAEAPKEDHSHLAPEPNTTLTLTGDNRTAEEKQASMPAPSNGMYMFTPTPQVTNQVAMAVGKDNRLWLKVDEKWHRVSIDS